MPSPNGYLSGFSYLVHDRQSFRTTLTHDINSPPWLPGQAGSYTLVWETGPTAVGPWTAAPLTDLGVGCTPQPDNETTVGGVTSTVVRIGDPTPGTGTTADTDYFVRVTILDPTDVQVDQWVLDSPAHTEAYPAFVCGGGATGETSADVFLGATAGQVNISAPCNEDTIVWELATTPGGPYTASPSEPVDGLSPGHTFTGLAAGTTYYWRGRLTEQAESGGEYLVSQECTFTTEAATAFTPECSAVGPFTTTSGRVASTADGVPADHTILLALGTAPGGPYTTLSPAAAGTGATNQPVIHTYTGLAPATTYYFRTEVRDAGDTVVESSTECSFTTAALPGPSPFDPQPCDAGAGADAVDVEQFVLCDLDAEGNLLGTALAVYEYDSEGNPTGAPTFVDPTTGAPYVAQGTLQPCPDAACLPPMQFCQTSTTTGPVDHPGRQYDITLPINPGFAVQSLQVDAVSHAAGITWEVDDPDGETFRQNLTTFMEGRVPAAATVTITNPNAGVPQVCGAAQPMTVHIECIRLDEDPPDLIELVYNGGQDLIQNPAYNEFPPLNPPVSQGNYGFHLLSRQDDPGPFPGNPPAGDVLCTSVANRGWETNDVGRTFEIWGQDVSNAQNTTPTPRGTPVQEITSDGPPPGGRSTIWQTFVAPASGNFIIRVVHGARDNGEQHRITLDNGDTNDAQNGDLIDDISNPPSVTSSGGPNPWTQFSQTIPLNGGSTYTLALSTNNPAGGARGGLFTDMRAFIDRPDLRATATTDDDTCVVTVDETTTNTTCSYWQPQCAGGTVVGWQKTDTGESLTNAEFWAQVPSPSCCLPDSGGDGGASSTLSNMLTSDIVCATVGGIPQNAIRVMVTDPSGGTLQTLFVGTDGAPIAPDTWTPGACTTSRYLADEILCDDNGPFLRKYVQSLDATNQAQVNSFRDFTLAGVSYTPVGTVGTCAPLDRDREVVCWTQNSTGDQVHTGTIRHDDSLPAPGWILFDQHQTPVNPAEPGLTFVPCEGRDSESVILCDSAAVPNRFIRTYTYTTAGAVAGFTDTTLAGAPFVPTGAVGVCAQTVQSDTDFVEEVLCDSNGTAFIRLFRFNSATGALISTTNTTLAGAAFAPVGTVGVCSDCCPNVVGEGCTNTGSGRYTAIRAVNGTITLIDSVSGATVLAANIVPCSDDDTVRTLTAQARVLTNGTPWTPGGDVTGTLTSLTVTGTLGLWDLVDADGTVVTGLPAGLTLTWNAEDDNQLTGPQSVTPQVGSTVVANWTQR
ncbi:hypothetical protein [Streptomyces sp. NRRL B-1347]|uniref:hypothetical protein n=1 Tax=Streptomyces sp. NRRL B-1347 TaxID=1476877 RepID=UPI0004C73077|nr:hypothetical protein [Streptomyces sp. NRRL B-1347]